MQLLLLWIGLFCFGTQMVIVISNDVTVKNICYFIIIRARRYIAARVLKLFVKFIPQVFRLRYLVRCLVAAALRCWCWQIAGKYPRVRSHSR